MRLFIESFLAIQLLFSFTSIKGQASLPDSLFHPDSLCYIIEVLASDSLNGRFTGTAENHIAFGTIGLVKGNHTPTRIKKIY